MAKYKSHIYIILIGAVMWILIYFISQSGLEKTKTRVRGKFGGSPFLEKNKETVQTVAKQVTEYSVSSEQKTRRATLKEACKRLKMNDQLPTDDINLMIMVRHKPMYFSDKFKFVGCMIPKVGCTNFKRVMLVEHGLTGITDPENLTGSVATEVAKKYFRLDTLKNATDIRTRLKNYYKFLMVREPMHRVLSAFRNKFENLGLERFRLITNEIIKFLSKEIVERSDHTLTFGQFLRYITASSNRQENHWKHYHKLCSPCSIKYDFIAKLETVDDDMQFVMKKVGMTNVRYPGGYLQPTDKDKVIGYYKQIPANLTRSVYTTYKSDYEMFGYSPPDFLP